MAESRRLSHDLLSVVAVTAAVLLCLPSAAAGWGRDVTEDSSTAYEFGWSADRQMSLGGPLPITLQYHQGDGKSPDPGERCQNAAPDGVDEPVRAFRFFNDVTLEPRVQISKPGGILNKRLVGTDLHDARKESSPSILQHSEMEDAEYRACGGTTDNFRQPSPDMTFYGQHHWNQWATPVRRQACTEDFDDNEWIASPYYVPGENKVYALMHQESRVQIATPMNTCVIANPPYCSYTGKAVEGACWLASITFAESTSVDHCHLGQYDQDPLDAGENATTNGVGACFQHNEDLAEPFIFPAPIGELDKHVVATIPYQYYKDWGCSQVEPPLEPHSEGNPAPLNPNGGFCGRHGYKEISNVIKGVAGEGSSDLAGKYFVVADVSAPKYDAQGNPQPELQKSGNCLLQTDTLGSPESWLAWDGESFSVDLRTGYTLNGSDPANHVCEPVVGGPTPWSLTYNRYLKKYMLLGTSTASNSEGEAKRSVSYRLSDDLRNWSTPQVLAFAPTRNAVLGDCVDGVTYPVVIDPDDPAKDWPGGSTGNPNFDHPGPTPDLYFAHTDQLPQEGETCPDDPMPPDGEYGDWLGGGNIARMPIDLRQQRQATFEDALEHATWGFDSTVAPGNIYQQAGSESLPEKFGYGERDLTSATSMKFVRAEPGFLTNTDPHGVIDVKWTNRDEVWYGAAFFLPLNFQGIQPDIEIMRWETSSSGDYGGIGIRSDDRFHLVSGPNEIGQAFDIPTGRWTWVEVHQKFDTEEPYSEVFVDGRLRSSSTSPNRQNADPITKLGIGFASTSPYSLGTMSIDRVSILGGQRGAVRGSASGQAPDTPTGLRASTSAGEVQLVANPNSVSPSGYRFYRRAAGGRWVERGFNTSAPEFQETLPASCTDYDYRISAYKQGVESVVSSPVTVTSPCP